MNTEKITEKQKQVNINNQEDKDRTISTQLFNELFVSINIEERDITAHTDCYLTGYTEHCTGIYNIEIKERNMYSYTFNNCYLELTKFSHLKEDENTHNMVYLCIYKDCILVWNLSKMDMSTVKKSKEWMKESTFKSNKKVQKDVYSLPTNKAKNLNSMAYINLGPKKPRKDFRKKERQEIYNTKRWRDLRAVKLMLNPLCEECEKMDKVTVATECHHVDSFMKYEGNLRIEKAYDLDNIESLCRKCHQAEHKNNEFKH